MCGKALKHVLFDRLQMLLGEAELYPNIVIGFQNKLGTQDAMLQV